MGIKHITCQGTPYQVRTSVFSFRGPTSREIFEKIGIDLLSNSDWIHPWQGSQTRDRAINRLLRRFVPQE